jgi:hypothetical protein
MKNKIKFEDFVKFLCEGWLDTLDNQSKSYQMKVLAQIYLDRKNKIYNRNTQDFSFDEYKWDTNYSNIRFITTEDKLNYCFNRLLNDISPTYGNSDDDAWKTYFYLTFHGLIQSLSNKEGVKAYNNDPIFKHILNNSLLQDMFHVINVCLKCEFKTIDEYYKAKRHFELENKELSEEDMDYYWYKLCNQPGMIKLHLKLSQNS